MGSEVKTWPINSANPGPVTGDDYKLLTSGWSIVSVFIPHFISLSCSPRLVKYCTSTSLPSLISRLFSTRSSPPPPGFTPQGESFSFNAISFIFFGAGLFLSLALGECGGLDGLWPRPLGERRGLDGLWRPRPLGECCGLRGGLSPKVSCCSFTVTPHADNFSFSWSCGVGFWCPWDTSSSVPCSSIDTHHGDNRSSKSLLFVLAMLYMTYMPAPQCKHLSFYYSECKFYLNADNECLLCETGSYGKPFYYFYAKQIIIGLLHWYRLGWFLFYGPSTHFRSFRALSVNLATLFLGKPPRQFTST